MKQITLTLPRPVSANLYWRTRVVKNMAMTYVSAEAKAYKAQVTALARAAGVVAPISGRVQLEVWLYPHRPQDWQKRQRKLGANWDDGVQSIDLDNAHKVLLDAMKGVCFNDDRFVFRIASQRMEPDDQPARVVVRVTSIATPQPQAVLL